MPTGERLTQIGAWQVIRHGRLEVFKIIKCFFVRMATENSVSDDNRTAVGQVKSVRRVPISRSTMVYSRCSKQLVSNPFHL